MKTKTLVVAKISILVVLAFFTSSCGTSKSANNGGSIEQASVVEVEATKPVASCNQLNKAGFLAMNVANVVGSDGKPSEQWVKLKFLNIASTISSQSMAFIRIYKWRVINNSTQLDSVPLQLTSYSLASGQGTGSPQSGIYISGINSETGFMVNLRDDLSNPYQVLKVVAYKSDGTVLDQANVLIPQILANPEDYKLNPNGTPRADLLQQMHLLYGMDVSSYSRDQIEDYFAQYCF